jgi:hypothetical protein
MVEIRNSYKIVLSCFVFGPYDVTPLPATDSIRRGLSGSSAFGDSVQAECRLVWKNGSVLVCRREFQQKFLGIDVPETSTTHYLVIKFKTTGLVLDKKAKRRRHVLTEEKRDNTNTRLERSSRKYLAKVNQQTDVSVSSARTATILLKLRL